MHTAVPTRTHLYPRTRGGLAKDPLCVVEEEREGQEEDGEEALSRDDNCQEAWNEKTIGSVRMIREMDGSLGMG